MVEDSKAWDLSPTLEDMEKSYSATLRLWVAELLKAYVGDVTGRLQNHDNRLQDLTARLDSVRENPHREQDLARITAVEGNLATQIQKTEIGITELNQMINNLRQELTQQSQSINENLSFLHREMTAPLTEQKAQLQATTATSNRALELVQGLTSRVTELGTQLVDVIRTKEEQIQVLGSQLSTLKNTKETQDTKIKRLEDSLSGLTTRINKLETQKPQSFWGQIFGD